MKGIQVYCALCCAYSKVHAHFIISVQVCIPSLAAGVNLVMQVTYNNVVAPVINRLFSHYANCVILLWTFCFQFTSVVGSHTDRQTDRQADTYRQMDRHTDTHTHIYIYIFRLSLPPLPPFFLSSFFPFFSPFCLFFNSYVLLVRILTDLEYQISHMHPHSHLHTHLPYLKFKNKSILFTLLINF